MPQSLTDPLDAAEFHPAPMAGDGASDMAINVEEVLDVLLTPDWTQEMAACETDGGLPPEVREAHNSEPLERTR